MTYEIRVTTRPPGEKKTIGKPIFCPNEETLRANMREIGYHFILDVEQLESRAPYPMEYHIRQGVTALVWANRLTAPSRREEPATEEAEFEVMNADESHAKA